MSRPSKRFTPPRWSEILIPAILVLLLIILVGVIIFIMLAAMGIFSGA